MGMSEAETRDKLIDPRLSEVGWDEARLEREYPYKAGRVRLIGEQTTRDPPQFVDYVLREQPKGLILGVLEAKDEDHSVGAGLQQAMAYAHDLDVSFAYASNGHRIVEHDFLTGQESEIDTFPTPMELRERLQTGRTIRGPMVANRHGAEVRNPLIEPAWPSPLGQRMRYYQERAVSAAIEEMLAGKKRALLSLATGTGKTWISFNITWKLVESGYVQKVLFLADRVSLQSQAFNEFAAFGEARGVVRSEPPLHRDLHFAIYQQLYTTGSDGRRLYERYPADYFDLVIVDECHRSGYGDWSVILDHFDVAFHLGMTATPKRTDSIDTYEFFAGENRDSDGNPQPVYEYSLGRGIDDGYLATYKVHRVRTNIDAEGLRVEDEVARGAELIVPEGSEPQDVYVMREFEREIVVRDRTKVLCEDLAAKLRSFGVNHKTMVFCVTMEHAEQVRQELQNLLGPETGKQLYAARIVSEERDAVELLEQFQLSTSTEPVAATTVDLLTTGVNVPAARNIVFMKPIGSPTVFKQIIGRGSRIDSATGKEFFRIIDYTDATRLFDEWDIPPPQPGEEEVTAGSCVISGRVVDARTGAPIAGAAVSIRAGLHELVQVSTDSEGSFSAEELPEMNVNLIAAAEDYRRRQVRARADSEPEGEVVIPLRLAAEAAQAIEISGVEVTIAEETELVLGGEGRELTVTQYCDYVGEHVRTTAGDTATLAELWRDPVKRTRLREQLRENRADPAVLSLLLDRPDADEFDLLAHVAFEERIRSREERARAIEQLDQAFLERYDEQQRVVVGALLDKYRLAGVDEISTAEVFQVPPFIDEFGGVAGLARLFDGADGVRALLRDVQAHLYEPLESAA